MIKINLELTSSKQTFNKARYASISLFLIMSKHHVDDVICSPRNLAYNIHRRIASYTGKRSFPKR